MGGGVWTTSSYTTHVTASTSGMKGVTLTATGNLSMDSSVSAQSFYRSRELAPELDPKNIMRECCNTEEHPNTIPVILALDVTGSMGGASLKVAEQLNPIMTELYKQVTDVEFCIMGIGDLAYDMAPIQMSQFESDVRIAEQLDKIYFEGGGGGNSYESYTAAWYMGLHHTKLDCWDQGRRGIIITLGDEPLNPYLPKSELEKVTGDSLQDDISTKELYREVQSKYDVYHLAVDDDESSYSYHSRDIHSTWEPLLEDHFKVTKLNSLASDITKIIVDSSKQEHSSTLTDTEGNITW